MRHRKHTFKIGRRTGHRESLLANAVCSLIEPNRITTTLVKAKEIRRLADKMVTLGKEGTLHTRRQAIAKLHQVDKVAKLFSEIAPGFAKREGGYTRLMKIGPRIGDGAEMCIVEFVENDEKAAAMNKAATETAEAPATEAPATDAPAAEAPVAEEK
ncbi:MAG: 50S ribosomal protein L17 [Victivallales bacterium]|nr:50S ribosomal protein L17 [Victivallales bacterium]